MTYHIPHIPFQPIADSDAVVKTDMVRFTVLTDRLIRLEYDPGGRFEDHPSQAFWFRKQPVPHFTVKHTSRTIEIVTDYLQLKYRRSNEGFTPDNFSIHLKSTGKTWRYGDHNNDNLKGTGRTLDNADGPIPLEDGLMSRSGWALIDDSSSHIFNQDYWLEPRPSTINNTGALDLYFFGHGHDYKSCLRDFCAVSGKTPLMPRWALGNWWSRYWAYSQNELADLMKDFRDYAIPLSICIIDMDWHITETGNTSSGWTGYTWNKQLFPDSQTLINSLHQQGLRTALNLHPAEGIHPHEAAYPDMARYMGIDPKSKKPVPFDIADPNFTKGYFEILHHPQEEQGIDFWWMDWQQGQRIKNSKQELGKYLDPLWWLNHLHFYDRQRDGKKRGFIFSRWGGLGNHRYPIGFSGDSIVTWASLAFQPYFTSTASNVAFGWWSHDIGGHFNGMEDPELYTRWVQFGVFSPIMRLHCTKNPHQDRRPWAFGADVLQITRQYMQLRHQLIPYIYSMAWRFYQENIPLITPMYYDYPEIEEAYHCPNQYFYGNELLAAPYTSERDHDTNLSRQTIWLPAGDWFNFFSGEYHQGGKWITCHGTLDEIPIFAKAGATISLGTRYIWGGGDNPQQMDIQVFAGADGQFSLYEDDGETIAYQNGKYSLLKMHQSWENHQLQFHIAPLEGQPQQLRFTTRTVNITIWGIHQPDKLEVLVNGTPTNPRWEMDALKERLTIYNIRLEPSDELRLVVSTSTGSLLSRRDRRAETFIRFLRIFRLGNATKAQIDAALPEILKNPAVLSRFANHLRDSQLAALRDIIQ